jgi:tetratricopeptide (TPR) repeat protein
MTTFWRSRALSTPHQPGAKGAATIISTTAMTATPAASVPDDAKIASPPAPRKRWAPGKLARAGWGMVRRRPVASVLVLLAATACLVALGVQGWAFHDYFEAGRALDDDRLAEAHAHVGFCLLVWPWSADTHFLAARIDRMSEAYAEAEAQLDECRRLQGPSARTQLEVLMLRAQRGEVDKVGDGLANALEHGEGDERDILQALARGYMVQMHYAAALALLNRCLDKHPDDVRALDWRGWVLERLQQQEKAASDYEHALSLAPGRVEVRMRLALLYLDHNDPVHAEPHLLQLAKVDPNRPEVLLALARCRFMQGAFDQAGALLDRVLAAQPDDPTALLYRGKMLLGANPPQLDEAESCFRRVLKATPNDPEAHWALHDCLSAQPGREAEADAEAKKHESLARAARRMESLQANELDQSPTDPAPAYELAKLNWDLGNDDVAKHWLNVALERDRNHQPSHALLAELYEKKGDKDAAARERALAGKQTR